MDKEVLRDIWHGQLPLCFKLHPDDVSGMHRPEPYYMMVPRVTYFPIVLDRVVKYFNRFMDHSKQSNDDMWLDYDGQPIKWQHPIGLSWDLLGSSYDLPWRVILHFSDFPAKELVRCNTKSSIKTNLLSSIKEADALKHKSSVIRNVLEKDQNLLWSSLVNHKYDQFWSVNKRLMDRIDNELFRYIPFRLYFPDYTYVQRLVKPCTTKARIFKITEKQSVKSNSPAQQQIPLIYDTDIVISKTHKCSHTIAAAKDNEDFQKGNSEHRSTTMLDLIHVIFANRLDDLLIKSSSNPPNNEEPGGTKDKPTYCDDSGDDLIDVNLFKYTFLTHGIEIPFDTPLQWLSEHLSYPDNFLHICAVLKT